MKKYFMYVFLLIGGLSLTTSCGDDIKEIINNGDSGGNNGDDKEDDENSEQIISKYDAQEELERVGKELLSKINAEDFKQITHLFLYVNEMIVGEDEYESVTPDLDYNEGIQKEINTRSKSTVILRNVLSEASHIAQGNISCAASKRLVGELIDATEYYGTYTWNEEMEDWDITSNTNAAVFKFDHEGTPCEVTLKGSGKTYTVDNAFTDEDEEDLITVKIPEKLTATIVEGGTTLMSVTINLTECNQSANKYAINATCDICGYIIKTDLSDNDKKIIRTSSITHNDEVLISSKITINGKNLANDEIIYNEEFSSEDLKNASMECTIMNSLVLNSFMDNSNDLINGLEFESEYYYYKSYNSWTNEWYENHFGAESKEELEEGVRNAAKTANENIQTELTFKQGTYRAPITMQAYCVEEYSEKSETYIYDYACWDYQPVIMFNDGTTYEFEEFFTRNSFKSFIQAYNDFIEDFSNIID